MKQKRLFSFVIVLFSLLVFVPLQAQGPDSCPVLVEEAIAQADRNCDLLGRNEVCYGTRSVQASFFEMIQSDTFTQPADLANINDLQAISTQALDLNTGEVGVAIMKLQAMLPNTLPGQGVVMVMVGDMSLQNDVSIDEAVSPADPIPVMTAFDSNLRSGAGLNFNVLESVAVGTELLVDGVSEDSEWLRVVSDGVTRWISRSLVQASAGLADLPTISDQTFGAMQAFTINPNVSSSECDEAPDSLLVQVPQGANVTLRVNGANMTVGSTVVYQPTGDEIRLTVLDGKAVFQDGRELIPGFTASASFMPDNPRLIGRWENFTVTPSEKRERFRPFERISERTVNYNIQRPGEEYLSVLRQLERDRVPYDTIRGIRFGEVDFENLDVGNLDLDRFLEDFGRPLDMTLPDGCSPGICTRDAAEACGCPLCSVSCPSGNDNETGTNPDRSIRDGDRTVEDQNGDRGSSTDSGRSSTPPNDGDNGGASADGGRSSTPPSDGDNGWASAGGGRSSTSPDDGDNDNDDDNDDDD